MKILKILASNSKRFRFYGPGRPNTKKKLKKIKILKKIPGYVFWLKKLKNDIEIALQPTGTELQPNRIKITLRYISVKKKDVAL